MQPDRGGAYRNMHPARYVRAIQWVRRTVGTVRDDVGARHGPLAAAKGLCAGWHEKSRAPTRGAASWSGHGASDALILGASVIECQTVGVSCLASRLRVPAADAVVAPPERHPGQAVTDNAADQLGIVGRLRCVRGPLALDGGDGGVRPSLRPYHPIRRKEAAQSLQHQTPLPQHSACVAVSPSVMTSPQAHHVRSINGL